VPEPSPRVRENALPARWGFDLLEHIEGFLAGASPQTLLITGASGTGKSTLLQTIIPRLKGPRLFLAYRSESPEGGRAWPAAAERAPVSILFVDPETPNPEGGEGAPAGPEVSMSFAPAVLQSGESLPSPIIEAFARLAASGGGYLLVDSWDPSSEAAFRAQASDHGSVRTFETTTPSLRSQVGRVPVRTILALSGDPDPELISLADGIIDLGWETVEGFSLRVVLVPKLRRTPVPQTRYLYALEHGTFYCPPQLPQGFHPPIGPPDPDPGPVDGTIFPGSRAFADAFGRLRVHGITGLGISPRFPANLADVFLIPLVAHTLNAGGRVVWFPALASGPSRICAQLAPFVPGDFIRERLRILTAAKGDAGLGDLRSVALPARGDRPEGYGARPVSESPTAPIFPDAYDFLVANPAGRTSLVAISLEGFKALAGIAGIALDPATFFLRISAYQHLPGRHAVSFGLASDPLMQAMMPIMETYIRVEERYGRTVLFGERPRTSPYLLDWTDPNGRYTLVPLR
jgi:hypothetical protein